LSLGAVVAVTYLTGDVLDQLTGIPDGTIDLAATSPPFLALRDYNGLDGQWGSEASPAAFLDHLLTLAVELRRVLAPHGSIAVELGDTYSGSGGAVGDYADGGLRDTQRRYNGAAATARAHATKRRTRMPDPGWPSAKSLCLVPELFAASLAYGRNLLNPAHEVGPWLVRNVIVWARNNPPVGALGDKVRPATSFITVACPSPRRWFDLDAVRGPGSPNTHARLPAGVGRQPNAGKAADGGRGGNWATLDAIHGRDGAPPLDHWHDQPDGDLTWQINTAGSNLGHYAMWPATLAERLILSMCPAEVCRACGEPRRRITEQTEAYRTARAKARNGEIRFNPSDQFTKHGGMAANIIRDHFAGGSTKVCLGWSDCGHGGDYRPGHVLDPFAGTGTTLAVADIHGRDATGIDLDPGNRLLYEARYEQCWRTMKPAAGPSPITPAGEQMSLAL
jgi:hypothetical protein